jgi:hypothetical protein
MTKLVSGMPAPQFEDESSLSARIRDVFAYPKLKATVLDYESQTVEMNRLSSS